MADVHLNSDVVEIFRKVINEHKSAIRVSVLEDLVESCYGPQALLDGRRIATITDFKEWLEAKLQEAKQQDSNNL